MTIPRIKVLNQEVFTSQRLLKAKDEWVKELKKNRKKEMENLRIRCLGGMLLQGLERKDLLDLILAIDDQLEAAKKRIVVVPWLQPAAEAGGRAYNTGDIPTMGAFTGIDAVSHVGTGDVLVSLVGAGDDAADEAIDHLFNFPMDYLDNQLLLTEQNRKENMGNASGDPLACDFWLNPYIL